MVNPPKDDEIANSDEETEGYYFPEYRSAVSKADIIAELSKNPALALQFFNSSEQDRVELLGTLALKIAQERREQ